MPQSETQSKVYPQTHHSLQSTMPRMSYTGPLMPRPTPNQSSNPSFMQTVKEGFSFGIGASIARNVVDRIFGSTTSTPRIDPPATVDPKPVIGENQHLYHKCIQDGGKHETCKDYLV